MVLGVEEDEGSSGCSSGCQSGWTMYLDQSYEPPTSLPFKKAASIEQEEEEEEEEEEEDLSMISDASSGPPHFPEEDDNCYYSHSNSCYYGIECLIDASTLPTASAAPLAKNGGKMRRVEGKEQRESSSLLDDTASSPLFSFPDTSFNDTSNNVKPSMENVLEFSCGFSATHFKGKSALHKQMDYLHSSAPEKPTPARPICRDESERKMW